MRTLRDGWKYWLALAVVACLPLTGRAAMFQVPVAAGGGGGTVTGSVWFPGPFSVSGTNWYLNGSISNLALAPAFTNANMVFSNTIVVNATANALTNGILLTNAVKYAGTLATGGRTILVHMTRGEYWTPTNTYPSTMMLVDNVSTYWEPGAKWYSGKVTAASMQANMWDDSAGKVTNCNVYGWGEFYLTNDSAAVVALENASTMTFEAQEVFASDSDSAGSGGATTFNFLNSNSTLTANVRGTIHSDTYDAIYFNAGNGHKANIKARKISSRFGDILEIGGSAASWGDVVIEADVMERTATVGATWLGTAYIPQPSFMKIGGNVLIRAGSINCYSTNGSIYAGSETNYGLLANAVIKVAGNARRGVIDDGSGTGNGHTGVWLKNCALYGPTNMDVMNLTNQTALPTILDNCTIYPGFGATNWARGITPSSVVILGSLNVYPNLPVAANVTVLGTNVTANLDVLGITKIRGAVYMSNILNVTSGITSQGNVSGADLVASGDVSGATITASTGIGTAAINIGNPTPSSIAMLNGNGDLTNATLGAGLSLTGTTLSATGSGGSNFVVSTHNNAQVGTLTVTNNIEQLGDGATPGSHILYGTNNIGVVFKAANSNSVSITNVVGLLHKASAAVIVLDCNHGNRFQVTNRLGQGTTFVVTNLAQGQEITIKGSADGTSRSVTVVPQLGYLVRDFDAFGVAAALNKAITATNGNTFEINIAAAWEHGTNWADVVTRQATY